MSYTKAILLSAKSRSVVKSFIFFLKVAATLLRFVYQDEKCVHIVDSIFTKKKSVKI